MAVRFREYVPEDDGDIRRILRDNPMPGDISLSYEREPLYHIGVPVLGEESVTLVAEVDGEVAGFASRAIRIIFDGIKSYKIGYLTGLRVDSPYHDKMLTVRAFHWLKEYDKDKNIDFYLFTVIEGNQRAEKMLTNKRLGTNTRCIGDLWTYAIKPSKNKTSLSKEYTISDLSSEKYEDVKCFINKFMGERFPEEQDFNEINYPGFTKEDILVLKLRDEIVCVGGYWNQGSYKQNRISSYSLRLRQIIPLMNLYRKMIKQPILPDTGDYIKTSSVVFLRGATKYRKMLLSYLSERAYKQEQHSLLVGVYQDDVIKDYLGKKQIDIYKSHIYIMSFNEELPDITGNVLNLEISRM